MALQSITPLATITLQSSSTNVVFSSIPNNYRDLILVVDGLFSSGSENIIIRFNSDAGSNYSNIYMFGSGSSTGTAHVTGTGIFGGGVTTSNKTLQNFQIFDYSVTDKHKSTLNRTNTNNDATYAWAGRWSNTAAITSLEVRGSGSGVFASGTVFYLYGRIS